MTVYLKIGYTVISTASARRTYRGASGLISLAPLFCFMGQNEIEEIAGALRRLYSLGDKFAQALTALEKYQQIDDIIRELSEEVPSHLDRIDRLLLLIIDRLSTTTPVDHHQRKLTSELREEVFGSRRRSIMKQMLQTQSNLNQMEEQAAEYGHHPPLEVTNHIIKLRENFNALEQELDYFTKKG